MKITKNRGQSIRFKFPTSPRWCGTCDGHREGVREEVGYRIAFLTDCKTYSRDRIFLLSFLDSKNIEEEKLGQWDFFPWTYTSTISPENVYADNVVVRSIMLTQKKGHLLKCTISPSSPSMFAPKLEQMDYIILFPLYTFSPKLKVNMASWSNCPVYPSNTYIWDSTSFQGGRSWSCQDLLR